jgi:hypothetical protein
MYGRGWNITDRRYKGYVENKLDAIKDYQFSICMENSVEDGYITEKFIDSILCETVPIYYGSASVENWYGNCFEYIDVENDSIDKIKEIINDDKVYNFDKAKDFYLNINNPFNILLKYINNNDTNNNA